MPPILMPRLSDSMEEGTIANWLKSSGDDVKRGEPLVEIETDKATITYEADASGALEIIAQEGETLAVGEAIATIGGGDAIATKSDGPPVEEALPPASPRAPSAPAVAETNVKASPVARRLAEAHGVDLAAVTGSGPGGRIVKADIEAIAAATAPTEPGSPEPEVEVSSSGDGRRAKGAVQAVELSRVQQTIARRMAETKATVPDFSVSTEVDMAAAALLRRQLKELARDSSVPSFNDMVVKAAALTLREHPRVNGACKDGRLELYERINVGIAVASDDALIVPVVVDADRKPLAQIAGDARALAGRVRAGEITPADLSGGTFTVSNLGMFGVTEFTAIINPGQGAILAVGSVRDVPVVQDGGLAPGKRMTMTLACDHRILYGADAARFIASVRERLEQPLHLLS